jgi:hypothetical protein
VPIAAAINDPQACCKEIQEPSIGAQLQGASFTFNIEALDRSRAERMARPPKTDGKEGRDRTLGLATLDDVYAKLIWETQQFVRLERSPRKPNLPAKYMAQNAASTAWHMGDWLAAELDFASSWAQISTLTGQQLASLDMLQTWMLKDVNLRSCQQIALAVKHVTLNKRAHEPDFQTIDEVVDVYGKLAEDGFTLTEGYTVARQLPIHAAVWLEGQHRGMYDMKAILDGAATWWRDLLATLRS